MQHVLEKTDSANGIIHLANGDPRLAMKMLDPAYVLISCCLALRKSPLALSL